MASNAKKVRCLKTNIGTDEVSRLIRDKSDTLSYETFSVLPKSQCFKRVVINGQNSDYVLCTECNDFELIKYDTKIGAAALNKHLKKHESCGDGEKQMQTKITQHTRRKPTDDDKSRLADAVAIACALDFRPFTMIEGMGMTHLIQVAMDIGNKRGNLDTDLIIPSADTVRRHLIIIYDKLKLELVQHFKPVKAINITTDHWSDNYSNANYMTITASYYHLILEKLFSRVIGTFAIKDKKSNTTIDEYIKQLKSFGINEKIRVIVTDNASNMKSAFQAYDWIACTAHDLALVQKYSFAMDKSSVSTNPIPSLRILTEASKELVKITKNSSVNNQLKTRLRQEVATRWDTYHDMYKSILDNYESLKRIDSVQVHLNKINRGLLEEPVNLLSPLKELRMKMSKDDEPTFQFVAMTHDAIIDLMQPIESDNNAILLIKKRFIRHMKVKYKVNKLHILATFLCPLYSRKFTFSDRKKVDDAMDLLLKL